MDNNFIVMSTGCQGMKEPSSFLDDQVVTLNHKMLMQVAPAAEHGTCQPGSRPKLW